MSSSDHSSAKGGDDHADITTVEAQKRRQSAVTAEHSSGKRGNKKVGRVLATLVTIFVAYPMFTLWMSKHETAPVTTTVSGGQDQSVPATSALSREITSPIWQKPADDGSLPVGVWSESYFPKPGSRTELDAGNCVVYKVRYRLYNSAWMDHDCKNYPPATELQFMMLQAGIKKVPITIIQ